MLLAISDANRSIGRSCGSTKTADKSVSEITSTGFEEKVLTSQVYRRAQRLNLGHNPFEDFSDDALGTTSGIGRQSTLGASLYSRSSTGHMPNMKPGDSVPRPAVLKDPHGSHHSPGSVVRPQSTSRTNASRPHPDKVDGQPELLPAEQQPFSTIADGLVTSSLTDQQSSPTPVHKDGINGDSAFRRNVLSLGIPVCFFNHHFRLRLFSDGEGFIGSYCQLLVLQSLSTKIAKMEVYENFVNTTKSRCSDLEQTIAYYFDDVIGTGTGG